MCSLDRKARLGKRKVTFGVDTFYHIFIDQDSWVEVVMRGEREGEDLQ